MALYSGTRNTSGAGDAIVTAGATTKLIVGRFIMLEGLAAGDNTIIVKFVKGASTVTIFTLTLSNDVKAGVFALPDIQESVAGAALHVDLSAALAMRYQIDVAQVGA